MNLLIFGVKLRLWLALLTTAGVLYLSLRPTPKKTVILIPCYDTNAVCMEKWTAK